MNSKKKNYILVISIILNIALVIILFSNYNTSETILYGGTGGITTNQKYIQGLYMEMNVTDVDQVFDYIFSSLDDEIVIYPTENYYYFSFPAQGKTFGGTLTFFPSMRDNNSIGIGYIERDDVHRSSSSIPNRLGGWKVFGREHGLKIDKISAFSYNVYFKNKTVLFKLNDVGLSNNVKLLSEEEYVGPVFDESGMRFHLTFNNKINKLYYILNQDLFVPDTFTSVGYGIVRGERTHFVFYNDSIRKRMLLVGVENTHVYNNDWFDGPFDQLPDNYVYSGDIKVQPYLEKHFGFSEGTIDKYGYYVGTDGRVALAPYIIYISFDSFSYVSSCETSEDLYTCMINATY